MISRLRGKVVMRSPTGVVLDVGGVGYLVNPTDSARRKAEAGGEVVLETYLHVREDVLQLFGFAEPAELRRAIALEDTARFQAIPGIGKKTAERVVLELKERLGSVGEAQAATPLAPKTHLVARDALVELGYSLVEAETALAGTDPDAPPEERVREALRRAA